MSITRASLGLALVAGAIALTWLSIHFALFGDRLTAAVTAVMSDAESTSALRQFDDDLRRWMGPPDAAARVVFLLLFVGGLPLALAGLLGERLLTRIWRPRLHRSVASLCYACLVLQISSVLLSSIVLCLRLVLAAQEFASEWRGWCTVAAVVAGLAAAPAWRRMIPLDRPLQRYT